LVNNPNKSYEDQTEVKLIYQFAKLHYLIGAVSRKPMCKFSLWIQNQHFGIAVALENLQGKSMGSEDHNADQITDQTSAFYV